MKPWPIVGWAVVTVAALCFALGGQVAHGEGDEQDMTYADEDLWDACDDCGPNAWGATPDVGDTGTGLAP